MCQLGDLRNTIILNDPILSDTRYFSWFWKHSSQLCCQNKIPWIFLQLSTKYLLNIITMSWLLFLER